MPKRTKPTGSGSKAKRAERRGSKFSGTKTGGVSKPSKSGAKTKHSTPKHRPKTAASKDGGSKAATKPFRKQSTHASESKSKPDKKEPMTKADIKKAAEELKMSRKLFRKPSYGVIQEITTSWEKFRSKSTTKEEKVSVFKEIIPKVKGKVVEVATDHKGSRVLQAILKDCNSQQRAVIESEIKTDILNVAKSNYGNFLVRAMLEKADKPELARLLALFKGKVTAIAKHPCAAAVLEVGYNLANKAQKTAIIAEFYGPEFAMRAYSASVSGADGEVLSLQDAMQDASKEGRKSIIQNATRYLTPIWEKGMVSFNFAHRVFAEFVAIAPPLCKADMCEHLAGDVALIRMMHTLDGIRTVCALMVWAGAKERKKMVKSMKSTVMKIAADEYGNMAIVCAMEVVDDTVLLRKIVVSELKANLETLAMHKHARRCILHLLAPRSPRYFPPVFSEMLPNPDAPATKQQSSKLATPSAGIPMRPVGVPPRSAPKEEGREAEEEGDGAGESDVEEEEEEAGGVSKKAPHVRRRELLGGNEAFGRALVEFCTENADAMLREHHSAEVLMETVRGGVEGDLAHSVGPEAMRSLHEAIAQLVAAPRISAEDAEDDMPGHLLDHFTASRMLRQMALEPSLSTKPALDDSSWSGFPSFGATLWKGAFKKRVVDWLGTHAEKVLAAVGSCDDASTRKELATELSKAIKPKKVEEWLGQFRVEKGAVKDAGEGVAKGAAVRKKTSRGDGEEIAGSVSNAGRKRRKAE